MSVDTIAKLEQGVNQDARLSTLRQIAGALDVDVSLLLSRGDRSDTTAPDRSGYHARPVDGDDPMSAGPPSPIGLLLRDSLIESTTVAATGEAQRPVQLPQLRGQVADLWSARQASRYEAAAVMLDLVQDR